MAKKYPFGNDPAKIEGYKAFWNREDVKRPLVGFSFVGWFPLEYFAACKSWHVNDYITPEMIDPESWLDDQERLLEEGDDIEDDILRGACPSQVAFPCFLPASLGSKIIVLPGNVMGEERKLSWEEALKVRLDHKNRWFKKYIEFAQALAKKSNGRYPISHGAEVGGHHMRCKRSVIEIGQIRNPLCLTQSTCLLEIRHDNIHCSYLQ